MPQYVLQKIKLISIYFGNLFEHYDTALYTFLSPFFAKLFFPEHDGLTALILTFAIAPLGMIARPIGALIFGFIGDTKGRGRALSLSLLGMATVTACIGIMPTTTQIGTIAPLLLLLSRILQNFFAAGEITGGAIYYLESVKNESRKDFASSVYSTSTVAGILLASGMIAILYHFNWIEKGWRWLYLGGSATALFGVFIRYLSTDQEFQITNSTPIKSNFFERLKAINTHRKAAFSIAIASGFSYATYLTAFTLMNGFVPLISSIKEAEITKINTGLLLFDLLLLPVFGAVASRFNRVYMMQLSALSAVSFGIPLFYFLENGSILMLIFIRMCFVIIGVWFSATFYSWAESLIPQEHRYSVISFSYSIGSQAFGSSAAAISLWLYKQTSLVTSASWYWIFLGALTFACLYKTQMAPKQTKLSSLT